MDRFDVDPRENYPTPRQEAAEQRQKLADRQRAAIERIAAAINGMDEVANRDITAPDYERLCLADVKHAEAVAKAAEAMLARFAQDVQRQQMRRAA